MSVTLHDNSVVMDTRRREGYALTCHPLIFDLNKLQQTEMGGLYVTPLPLTFRLASKVRRTIVPRPDQASSGQLLFLSNMNWVLGVSLEDEDAETCTQYFPVPMSSWGVMAGMKYYLSARLMMTSSFHSVGRWR